MDSIPPLHFLGGPLRQRASQWALSSSTVDGLLMQHVPSANGRHAGGSGFWGKHEAAQRSHRFATNHTQKVTRRRLVPCPQKAARPRFDGAKGFEFGQARRQNPESDTPCSPRGHCRLAARAEWRHPRRLGKTVAPICAIFALFPAKAQRSTNRVRLGDFIRMNPLATAASRLPDHYEENNARLRTKSHAAFEYRDDSGKRHVKPHQSRVWVFAPRCPVTSISRSMKTSADPPLAGDRATGRHGLSNREGTFAQHQRDAGQRRPSRESGHGRDGTARPPTRRSPDPPSRPRAPTTTPPRLRLSATCVMKQAEEARPGREHSVPRAVLAIRTRLLPPSRNQRSRLKKPFSKILDLWPGKRLQRQAHNMRSVKSADKRIAEPGDIVNSARYTIARSRGARRRVCRRHLSPHNTGEGGAAGIHRRHRLTCDRYAGPQCLRQREGIVILSGVLAEP